ncbi:uncharacterized protein LAESUDRAFT_27866 [Laetiporus sulphureus 93-53]|uniref:Uncharacterized protein n=1 Tax=Laetiporus sulphureus 93-53 TaxID=1314785 RepID=A0A165IGX6_9APHY|nr:uncharacterized protein LAESUDRAFT_27866 [Laetiporus sulphureus 93-53]KZT13055.1 hypothetical protein LAESUDRAFT_27866 [Laetiporus sulphureus 93-53]
MATNGPQASYACNCLNVRIHPQPPQGAPPPSEDDYEPVFAGDTGVSVVHVKLTLRSRTRPVPEQHGELATRYVSLTCMLCQCLVYRVRQVVHLETDGGEGPVLPVDDWVEQDILKSATGWIEVSKGCMTGEAISKAEASPAYSKLFGVILPAGLPTITFSAPSSSPTTSTPAVTKYLPPVPPLFSPPPFTPSHPVFAYLVSIANAEMDHVRASAEEHIAKVVEEKTAEIKEVEGGLRQRVELLWSKFKENLDKIDQEHFAHRRPPYTSRRGSSEAHWGGTAHEAYSSVRINEFIPNHNIPPRTSPAASPRHLTSALSASLATSSFHHPRREHDNAAPRAESAQGPSSPSSLPSPSRAPQLKSPSSASSHTLVMAPNDEASTIREAYRRNMDQSKDIATSFRYVHDLEEQMQARYGQATSSESLAEASSSAMHGILSTSAEAPRGRSPRAGKSSIRKGKEKENAEPHSPHKDEGPAEQANTGAEVKDGGAKKRKVTFDVKPEVAIIGADAMEAESTRPQDEEIIFEMEGEEGTEPPSTDVAQSSAPSTNGHSAARTAEAARTRHPRNRLQDNYGLPSSLSALRPSSLPNVSNIRAPARRVDDQRQDRPRSEIVREAVMSAGAASKRDEADEHIHEDDAEEVTDPREAEILRLVAASTPSHRSAWKRDSKAWQLFVNRQDRKSKEHAPAAIEEEGDESAAEYDGPRLGQGVDMDVDDVTEGGEREDGLRANHHYPVASSLPIPISLNGLHFGAASYEPKTSLTEQPGTMVPALRTMTSSSAAVRRQIYLERDRQRSIDPGALDFTEDMDDEEEPEIQPEAEVGSLAQKRALQILEASNRIPEGCGEV